MAQTQTKHAAVFIFPRWRRLSPSDCSQVIDDYCKRTDIVLTITRKAA